MTSERSRLWEWWDAERQSALFWCRGRSGVPRSRQGQAPHHRARHDEEEEGEEEAEEEAEEEVEEQGLQSEEEEGLTK